MMTRVIADLEPGMLIGKSLPGIDLLDVAYGAAHGGARGVLLPISATGRAPLYTADAFDRPGLPTLIVKCSESELERAAALGSAPERLLVTGERNSELTEFSQLADHIGRSAGTHQELGVLADAEPAQLKVAARAGVNWVYFSSQRLFASKSLEEAQTELATLSSATLAATKLGMRAGVIGPMGKHLPQSLAALAGLEELIPTPDLWQSALRVGWERAVQWFIDLCK